MNGSLVQAHKRVGLPGFQWRRKARAAKNSKMMRAVCVGVAFLAGLTKNTRPAGAASATIWAASKYRSIRSGGTYKVSALLSKPPPPDPSAGKLSAGRTVTPNKSRTELLYSERLNRCRSTRPGVLATGAAVTRRLTAICKASCSSVVGCFAFGGGISRSWRRPKILRPVSVSPPSLPLTNLARVNPPLFFWALWQGRQ